MLLLEQKTKNNFFSHNMTRNSKKMTTASPLATIRLGNHKTAFPSRSPHYALIKIFPAIKTKY
jgi:hypothetical protein